MVASIGGGNEACDSVFLLFMDPSRDHKWWIKGVSQLGCRCVGLPPVIPIPVILWFPHWAGWWHGSLGGKHFIWCLDLLLCVTLHFCRGQQQSWLYFIQLKPAVVCKPHCTHPTSIHDTLVIVSVLWGNGKLTGSYFSCVFFIFPPVIGFKCYLTLPNNIQKLTC